MRGLMLAGLLCVAGCAAPPPEPPQFPMNGEAPVINEAGAGDVASDLAQLVATRLKPADGTLSIAGDDPLISRALTDALKANGYRMWPRNAKHAVAYSVSQLGPTLLVRLHVDSLESARLYRSGSAGEILPASPTSLTEG